MLVARKKYLSLVHIANSPQTNREYKKEYMEQDDEWLHYISTVTMGDTMGEGCYYVPIIASSWIFLFIHI